MVGMLIGLNDMVIVGYVIVVGVVLVMNNMWEFEWVLGFVLEDWVR